VLKKRCERSVATEIFLCYTKFVLAKILQMSRIIKSLLAREVGRIRAPASMTAGRSLTRLLGGCILAKKKAAKKVAKKPAKKAAKKKVAKKAAKKKVAKKAKK
jgi:hypothetical protein